MVNQANQNTCIIISLRWRSLKYPIATLTPTTSLPPLQDLHTTLASQREITTAQNSPPRFNFSRFRVSLRASTSAVAPESPIPFPATSTQNNESEWLRDSELCDHDGLSSLNNVSDESFATNSTCHRTYQPKPQQPETICLRMFTYSIERSQHTKKIKTKKEPNRVRPR